MIRKFLITALALAPLAVSGSDIPEWTANDGQMVLQGVPAIPEALVNRLNQYQSVRSASFLGWTRTGRGLYVRTRFGDVSQIHSVHAPGGVRRQLTWFREPMGQVLRRPKSGELAITMDQGGGEFDQIYLFDTNTAQLTLLTDGRSRNRHVRWMTTELAWSWLRYQPESALSVWFRERFGDGGKRG